MKTEAGTGGLHHHKQGMPLIARNHQKLGEWGWQDLPQNFQEKPTIPVDTLVLNV